jgi:hypothetical protein
MLGKFVQITPDLLAQLMEEPDRVSALFMEQLMPAPRPLPIPDAIRQAALRRAPQVLAASAAAMDPTIRAALDESLKRLGTSVEELQSGKRGDLMAQLMARARDIVGAAQAPAGPALKGKGAEISLDKAWHGVHYLLCGEAEPGSSVLSQAVLGGTEIGDDEMGYGPARVFTVRQAAETARELSRAGLEDEMKARFDPDRMGSAGIYPEGWHTAGALDWLLEEFHRLRDFYADASARQFAIVACLV